MKAVIYARYSSDRQRDVSIEQQVLACRRFADTNSYTVTHVYADHAITGRTDDRPQFLQMIKDSSKKEFQIVIVYALDRFSRSVYDSCHYEAELGKNGVSLYSATEPITSDPAGILVKQVFRGFAEYYTAELAQKIRRGYENNASHFLACGSVPYGYRRSPDGHYLVCDEEAEIVREIFSRVAAGDAFVEISESLNARGIKTKHGKAWSRASYNTMLSNDLYIGVYTYHDQKTPDKVPPIISKELFYKVQKTCDNKKNPRHSGRRRSENGIYLLTGKLYCGKCQERMVGISGTRRDGEKEFYYICKGKHTHSGCDCPTVKRDILEQTISTGLKDYVLTDDNIKYMAENSVMAACGDSKESERQILQASYEAAKKAKENALKAILAGIINDSVKEALTQAENEELEYKNRLDAIDEELANQVTVDDIISYLELYKGDGLGDQNVTHDMLDAFVLKAEIFDGFVRVYFSVKKESCQADIPLDSSEPDLDGSYSRNEWRQLNTIRTVAQYIYYIDFAA